MQPIIDIITQAVTRRPAQLIVASLLLTLLLSSNILRTPLDLSFVSVFGDESDLMGKYVDMSRDVGLSRRLLLLLESEDDAALDRATSAVAEALENSSDIDYVIAEPPTEWLRDHAIWVIDEPTLALWIRWIESGDQRAAWNALQDALLEATEQSSLLRVDGARLVIVGLTTDPLNIPVEDVVAGRDAYASVEQTLQETLREYDGVTSELAGLGALASQDQRATLKSIGLISPLGILAVLLLLRLVERSWIRLALIAIPLVLASGATLGLVGLILGVITFTEAFFGVLVFGLGIDFALHLLIRLREERSGPGDFDEALSRTLKGSGPGIILGALTTVTAFAVIATAPDPVARHLGVSGALGIMLCLILMLTFLPASLRILESRRPAPAVSPFETTWLSRLTEFSVRSPVPTLVITTLLVATALLGSSRFHFERDLQKLFNRDVRAVATGERLKELFGATNTPWVVASTSEAEARRIGEAFRQDPTFDRVEGIDSLFPQPLAARHELLTPLHDQATKLRAELDAHIETSTALFKEPMYQRRERIQALLDAIAAGPPSLNDLPSSLERELITPDGRLLTYAYTQFSGLDAEVLRAERVRAEAIAPGATGLGAFIEGSLGGSKGWALPVFGGISGLVLTLLMLSFRDPRWVLVALSPVLVGTALTFGLLCWLEIGFSVLLIVVIPLLVGLGVDDGIHIAHRLRHDKESSPAAAVSAVGHAILMTTLTTCGGVVALLFSNHPGMESMSLTLLIGLPSCLLASVTVAPALARMLQLRS